MTQKQILGVAAGVVVVLLVSVGIYRQFRPMHSEWQTKSGSMQPSAQRQPGTQPTQQTMQPAPVPDSIDGISESIASESSSDVSALDQEGNGEAAELDEDAKSVNNLENSYDANSF